MENKDYILYNTYYDKEVLRKVIILLNDEKIDFKILNKSTGGSFRAPQSVYVEADLMILRSDYQIAANLIK